MDMSISIHRTPWDSALRFKACWDAVALAQWSCGSTKAASFEPPEGPILFMKRKRETMGDPF